MDAPRDLYLTRDGQLCEANSEEAAFLFHRAGQTIATEEETKYGVAAYLERMQMGPEARERILAEAKAVEQAEVEDKAMPGPGEVKGDPEVPTEPTTAESRRTGGGRRGA